MKEGQNERGKRVLSNEAAKIHICSEVCGTTSGIWLLIGRHIRQEVDLLILLFVTPAWEDHGWDGWRNIESWHFLREGE